MGPNEPSPADLELEHSDQEEAQAQQSPEPKYVTEEALERIMETTLKRFQQSSRDQAKNIEAALEGMKQQLSKANVTLTPEQEAGLRQQIIASQEESNQDADQRNPDQAALAQQVFDETQAIFDVEGVIVKKTDPEFRIITAALQDPNGNMPKYRSQVYRAIAAKRSRLEASNENADARTLGDGGNADSNDISKIEDPGQLMRMGEERLRKQRR